MFEKKTGPFAMVRFQIPTVFVKTVTASNAGLVWYSDGLKQLWTFKVRSKNEMAP